MSIGKYKMGVQHAHTLLSNVGSGSVPTTFEVLETEAGLRTTTGGSQTIKDSASTAEVVNIGDTVKYINLFIQCAPRNGSANLDKGGWMEWAFVCVKESETTVPITDIGIQTLGVICTNMFRNECIYTGAFPMGTSQSNNIAISLKIPRFKQRIRFGDEWRLICYFRAADSTSVSTTAVRLLQSFMYKAYS